MVILLWYATFHRFRVLSAWLVCLICHVDYISHSCEETKINANQKSPL